MKYVSVDVIFLTRGQHYYPGYNGYLKKFHFGEMVCTGCQGRGVSAKYYVGKILQLRHGAGAFGSDAIFIRHPDGKIIVHHNQGLYKLDPFRQKKVRKLFSQKVLKHDKNGDEYSALFMDLPPKRGFIIEREADES